MMDQRILQDLLVLALGAPEPDDDRTDSDFDPDEFSSEEEEEIPERDDIPETNVSHLDPRNILDRPLTNAMKPTHNVGK